MDLNRYQSARYQDGGRGHGFYDCWGLVREVLHQYFDAPLYESYGNVSASDKPQMDSVSRVIIKQGFEAVKQPAAGIVAAGYLGKRLQHVGVFVRIDGTLRILHAHQSGIRLDTFTAFQRCAGSSIKLFKAVA